MEIVKTEKVGRFTIAQVREVENDKIFTGIGIARCSNDDAYRKDVGEEIALGRAASALEKKKKGKEVHNIFMG